jgi:MHS family proline/betaine transporter-like MFS transporter
MSTNHVNTGHSVGTKPNESLRKVIAGSMAGNVLEWFDFSSYAFFATYISMNFFKTGDTVSGLISTFIVFGVGYVARPLGALFLGAYGDIKGRKATLMLTVTLMAAGTFIIGFAPPIGALGVGATILLFVGRILQGFSAGGEIGGATSYLVEKAPEDQKIRVVGWLQGTMGISNAMSAVIGLAITTWFTDEQIIQWAWRIPFFIGLSIIPVALYIRSKLSETAEFSEMAEGGAQSHKKPIRTLFLKYWKNMVIAGLMAIVWHASVYALVIFGPTYYSMESSGLGFSSNNAFLASLLGNIAMIFACVGAAIVAQKIGFKRALTAAIIIVGLVPLTALVILHMAPSLPMLLIVHVVICLAVSGYAGIIPSGLAQIFPTQVRSTGTSLSYNIVGIAFAGMTPAFMTWATEFTVYSVGIYVALTALIALVCLPIFLRFIKIRIQETEHIFLVDDDLAEAAE